MSRAICLAMLCALHANALASPRTDPTRGRAVFTGAATPDATSIEVNPAALGLGNPNSQIYVAATATLDHLTITDRMLDIDTGALSDGDRVSGNLLSPGGMAAYVWHPTNRIALGVAFHTSPAERFLEDKEAVRYHTLGGSHRTYAPSIASSFRLTNRVHFGLSLAVHTSYLRLQFARDVPLAAGRDPQRGIDSDCGGAVCSIENPQGTERYDVDVSSDIVALDNVVGTLGVVVRIAREIYLGIAYHTPPGLSIQNELTGTVNVERAPRDAAGMTIEGGATVYISQPPSVDAELRMKLPANLELHVGGRYEWLSRMQGYDVRSYDAAFARNGIPEWQPRARGFNNSFAMWAGLEQAAQEFPLTVGGRIGFETASVPDNRTSPMTIAPASLTLDTGVQYRLTRNQDVRPQVVLQLAYGIQYFPTVDVTNSEFDPRDQLSCYDSGYDYSIPACEAVRHGYAIGTAAGEYTRIQQAMRLALRFTW
ncbi:MAG TPA: outer membrane protein transport protein [Kofleriaceae bacterium]